MCWKLHPSASATHSEPRAGLLLVNCCCCSSPLLDALHPQQSPCHAPRLSRLADSVCVCVAAPCAMGCCCLCSPCIGCSAPLCAELAAAKANYGGKRATYVSLPWQIMWWGPEVQWGRSSAPQLPAGQLAGRWRRASRPAPFPDGSGMAPAGGHFFRKRPCITQVQVCVAISSPRAPNCQHRKAPSWQDLAGMLCVLWLQVRGASRLVFGLL